jgi:hypothetical protein
MANPDPNTPYNIFNITKDPLKNNQPQKSQPGKQAKTTNTTPQIPKKLPRHRKPLYNKKKKKKKIEETKCPQPNPTNMLPAPESKHQAEDPKPYTSTQQQSYQSP